jgi:hypothetical protein
VKLVLLYEVSTHPSDVITGNKCLAGTHLQQETMMYEMHSNQQDYT